MKDQELRDLFRELLNYIGDRLDRVERNILERTDPKKPTPTAEEVGAQLRALVGEERPQKQWSPWIPVTIGLTTGAAIFAAGMLTTWLLR